MLVARWEKSMAKFLWLPSRIWAKLAVGNLGTVWIIEFDGERYCHSLASLRILPRFSLFFCTLFASFNAGFIRDCTVSSISSRKKTTMLLGNWLYYLFLFDLRVYHVKLCKAVLIRCLMLSIADENREDDAAAKILSNFFQIVLKYIYIYIYIYIYNIYIYQGSKSFFDSVLVPV